MIPLVGNPDKGISLRAVLALDSMGKFVDVVRDNADANILSPALTALKSKGVKTEEELTAYEKHLQHPEGEVKRLAALALIQLAPARLQVDRLTDLMLTPNDEVRNAAGKLLRAKLGEKLANVTIKDLPMLREGLKNPVREFRLSFVDAIGSLKANGQEAALDLAGLLGGPDKDISIQASRALEGMGRAAEKAVPTLEKTIASVDRSVAVAATIAMGKIDPANPTLRNKGVNLLIEDLDPDVKDLKTLLAQPLNSRSIATILEIGEPTIDPLVTYLLTRNSPKMVAQNKQLEAVAARYLGYEILKEFATQAKAKQDKKLIVALKKHESSLRAFWEPQETTLGNQARKAFGLPPETAQLYTTAARSANQARLAISALRVP